MHGNVLRYEAFLFTDKIIQKIMNRTKIIEHYKKFMQLDKMQEDYQIDIDWMQAFIEDNNLVNKNDLLPLVSFNAVEVLGLLTKLLEGNMCSHEGDRLINQLLKSKT